MLQADVRKKTVLHYACSSSALQNLKIVKNVHQLISFKFIVTYGLKTQHYTRQT